MAHGKIRVNTLTYDTGSGDVDVAVSGLGPARTDSEINTLADARITAATGSSVQAFDPDTAKTDVAQNFTAPQRGNVSSIASSGGSITFDFTVSNNFLWTLSENTTAVNITANSLVAGQSGSIFIAQPSSGGPYTVGGWDAAFLFSGANAPTITATASKTDRIDYVVKSATEIQVVWTGNY